MKNKNKKYNTRKRKGERKKRITLFIFLFVTTMFLFGYGELDEKYLPQVQAREEAKTTANVIRTVFDNVNKRSSQYKVEKLRNYLEKYNSPLAEYADEIVELYPNDYKKYIGITRIETSFCKRLAVTYDQVAVNNCVNIKSGKKDRVFKHYNSMMNSIADLDILLDYPLYAGKSLDEINGIYCQDESQPGRKCVNWTEVIEQTIADLTI